MKEKSKRFFCLAITAALFSGAVPFDYALASGQSYLSEQYQPQVQKQVITAGAEVFAGDSIKNTDALPEGTKYYFSDPEKDVAEEDLFENPDEAFGDYKPDTSFSGEKDVKIVTVYQDGSIDLSESKIIVEADEEEQKSAEDQEIKKEIPQAETAANGAAEFEKTGARLRSINPYAPTRTYRFVINGENGEEKVVSEVILTKEEVRLFAPKTVEKEGYKFLGWYQEDQRLEFNQRDENDDLYLNIEKINPEQEETVKIEGKYARYRDLNFFLKKDYAEDGEATPDGWVEVWEMAVIDADEVSLADIPLPLKAGEKLEGWYKDKDFSEKVDDKAFTVSGEDVNLYGKVIKGAWLIFDTGRYSHTAIPSQFLQAGEDHHNVTKDPTPKDADQPERFGYTFQHWTAQETIDENGEYTGEAFQFGAALQEDTKLYAVWRKNKVIQYNIRRYIEEVPDGKIDDVGNREKVYRPYKSTEEKIELRDGQTLKEEIVKKYIEKYRAEQLSSDSMDSSFHINGFHLPIPENHQNSQAVDKVIEFKESDGFNPAELRVYYSRDIINIRFLNEHDALEQIFTGLYGQNILKQNETYKWPQESYRENTQIQAENRRVTYLDSFTLDALRGVKITVNPATGKKTQTIELKKDIAAGQEDHIIRSYTERLDEENRYDLAAQIASKNGEFTVSDKYVGFKASYYIKDNEPPVKLTDENRVVKYEKTLEIYNARNKYKLTFDNGEGGKETVEVLYGTPLKAYAQAQNAPERPNHIPEKFTFSGWYNDPDFTNEVEWDKKTMPAEDMEVYAKWEPHRVLVRIYDQLDSEKEVSRDNTHQYDTYLNENKLPTVKQGDTVLYSGEVGKTITVPEGNTWYGWYEKDRNTGRYKKFDFNKPLKEDVDLYPYYFSSETVKAYYYKNKTDWENREKGEAEPIRISKPHQKNSKAVISGVDKDTNTQLMGEFVSWSDGEKTYVKGDAVVMDKDLHLYPIYANKPAKTRLIYKAGENGEGQDVTVENVSNNQTITLAKNTFLPKAGYGDFIGWENATDGKIYKEGDRLLVDPAKEDTQNILTARFKKKATFTGESAVREYNGSEHHLTAITSEGLLEGHEYEGLRYAAKGTDAGAYRGGFEGAVVIRDTDRRDVTEYYQITKTPGALTVTKGRFSVEAVNYEGVYDGRVHAGGGEAAAAEGTTYQYSTDGGKNWAEEMPTITDVGEVKYKVKAINANYEAATADGTLTVTKAPITITTGSGEKNYDGIALTNAKAEITGLVNGETATVITTGSQKEVGSSTNTYTIDWGETKKENYDVTEKLGVLTVMLQFIPLEPARTRVVVEKKWQDHEGKEIQAPVQSVTVKLVRDGWETDTELELNAENKWTGEFNNLPEASRIAGEKYNYTVKEAGEHGNAVMFDGTRYNVSYAGDAKDGFTIINKEERPSAPEPPEVPDKPEPEKPSVPEMPEKPGEPEPEKPSAPEPPEASDKPEPEKPGELKIEKLAASTPKEVSKHAPKTGDGLNSSVYAGAMVLAGGAWALLRMKRRKEE